MRLRVATVRSLLERLVDLSIDEQRRLGVTEDPDRAALPADLFDHFARVYGAVFRRAFTPTQAWLLWRIVFASAAAMQAGAQAYADVGFWFGVNPFALTARQRFALKLNLGRVKSQYVLAMGNYDAVDYQGVYNLVLAATGDEQQAVHARAEAMERMISINAKKRSYAHG